MTGKVALSLGKVLRRSRRERGETQGSMAAIIGVAENTYGRWERDEVTPSPSNMRALIRLGLIGGRQNRQGCGNGQEPQFLPPEATDRVMQTPGDPGSDLQVGMQAIQNAGDGEVLALFQSLSADKRKMALEILHLVIAISGPGNRRDPGGGTNLRQRVE